MNKKIILIGAIIFIVISLAAVGTLFYLHSKQFNSIKENGVSFKYLKGFEIKRDGPIDSDGRFGYQIRTKFTYDQSSFGQSMIDIVIPTNNIEKVSGGFYTLEDVLKVKDLKKENYIIPIQEININGHKGEMVKYRLDREYVGDLPTHSVFTFIYLDTKYMNAPITLVYENKDTNPNSLDAAWETILKTLKY
jgi:hypothetical protein